MQVSGVIGGWWNLVVSVQSILFYMFAGEGEGSFSILSRGAGATRVLRGP